MEAYKLTLDEIAAAARESRAVVYDAINAGHLQTFLVGRRRFARPEAVRAWVDFLQRESDAGRPIIYRPRAKAA
jgi:hypothetical protein